MRKKGLIARRAREKKNGGDPIREYAGILIRAALAEDVGEGDITTAAVVPEGEKGSARIIAREDLVLAGLFIAEGVFTRLDDHVSFKPFFRDGDMVRKGRAIAEVSGRLSPILTGERAALNFLQRLSGIATLTRKFIGRRGNFDVRILDTRKTTPCLRLIERYAVRAGGGSNHRFGLFDCILIKDNHIKAAGGVKEAIRRVNDRYHGTVPIEAEVTNLKETREAVENGADIIMLDNMDVPSIKKALRVIRNRAFVEVSGGVTLSNVRSIAATGVDFISIGALTHSAPSVDISMEVTSYARKGRSRT